MDETSEAVRFDAVSKRLGNHDALSSISFTIPAGTVFGLVGANGAGKTTTLRLILGLLGPDRGALTVFGQSPLADGAAIRRRAGVLLETDGLYGRMTALANLRFHAEIWHMRRDDFADGAEQLLRSFDLWERRNEKVITWSRGMRVKLALARALLHRPSLLLLDEPFAGLDPVSATNLRLLLAELAKREGITTVVASHDLAHVEQVCHTIAVVQAGHLLYCGPPEAITKEVPHGTVRVLVASPDLSPERLDRLVQVHAISSYETNGSKLVFTCSLEQRGRLGRHFLTNGIVVDELADLKPSLEQNILSLLSEHGEEST